MKLLLLLMGYVSVLHVSASTTVDAPCGKIKGAETQALNKKSYVAFRNIPYAKAPEGELRFAKPEPKPKFDDVFDGTSTEIRKCVHPDMSEWTEENSFFEGGVEDCLILNVYVPKLDSVRRKVMVFIHGGGFVSGCSDWYDAGNFVTEQDVIMVTINYRLGVLGFLSTGNDASPGNFGLWDQALALKWVKDNIAAFGGDADDIAISGESAGGASVAFLSMSPHTIGLFTKAYPQSGGSSAGFAIAKNPQAHALTVAKPLGCWDAELDAKLDSKQSHEIMDCLRKLPVKEFGKFGNFDFAELKFVPCVDGDFVPKFATELLKDDAYLESIGFFERKYLIAFNNNEVKLMENSLAMVEGFMLSQNYSSEAEKQAALKAYQDSIENYYIYHRMGSDAPNEKIKGKVADWYKRRYVNYLPELMNDIYFIIPSFDLLDAMARNKQTDAWLMYFNHFPTFMKGDTRGSIHGMDLLYWFDLPLKEFDALLKAGIQGEMDEEDLTMRSLFSNTIGEFVRTGDLTNSMKTLLPGGWPTYDLQGSYYLDFSLEPRIKRHLEIEKKDLWLKKVPSWLDQYRSEGKQKEEL